ncbi:hypothetical protein Nepgr_012020 [Nepenthes gracilis]|uniref:Protein MIZU-KUSSEI 1 n=1 Tax=Nepenthes gracilis TaxID=150966 RepID=A0AAD3SG80_NEPGR|nr:hypothetical protein Nepgr_012020 [Nepenthes gracilis]
MTKIDSLRRLLLPCFTPSTSTTATSSTAIARGRLSTFVRYERAEPRKSYSCSRTQDQEHDTSSTTSAATDDSATTQISFIPSRPSKSMVILTFFGRRHSHIWFCVQLDRLSPKPSILLELPLSTQNLVKEMRSGLLRIALECDESEIGSCPLHSVPVWTMYCNGRRVGFATRRKAADEIRAMLKNMQSMTVGAGVLPSGSDVDSGSGEIMYMRANYEWVVGNADSESFHLINPDNCPGQELSVFLLRSR